MDELRFEWDERKNRGNQRKHGISFEEAQTVFYDDWAIQVEDEDPVEPEDRFVRGRQRDSDHLRAPGK
jgi:uncharacterized DUF497 family protein